MADLTSVSTETDTVHRVRPRRVLPPDRQLDNEHVEKTTLVLNVIDRGLHQRPYSTTGKRGNKLAHHSDAGGQHTSFRFTPHPLESGMDASVGTVGDALDNTLTESMIVLRKTQLIKPRGPWHTIQEVDVTTTEYVDWHNNRRLHRARGSRPPVKYETLGDLISPVA